MSEQTPDGRIKRGRVFVYACDEIVQAEQDVDGFESLRLKLEVLRIEDAGDAGI